MLNKQKGNMYAFVTHTWNVCKGRCSHVCEYCYMRAWGEPRPLRLDEKEFKTDLGNGRFIFVGSSTDMFASDVPDEWIVRVIEHCKGFDNKYLFQSKTPERMTNFLPLFPNKSVLGTTIESNRDYDVCKAPGPEERAAFMRNVGGAFEKMVTIEPVMDFDLEPMIELIRSTGPSWVNIGADSKGHKLPEPSPEKLRALIASLEKFTQVKRKKNLNRLLILKNLG